MSLAIVGGYLMLAIRVPEALFSFAPPDLDTRTRRGVLYGGIIFFITCAITHLDQGLHLALFDASGRHMAEFPHVLNCIVQAGAVWWFAIDLPRFLDRVGRSLR